MRELYPVNTAACREINPVIFRCCPCFLSGFILYADHQLVVVMIPKINQDLLAAVGVGKCRAQTVFLRCGSDRIGEFPFITEHLQVIKLRFPLHRITGEHCIRSILRSYQRFFLVDQEFFLAWIAQISFVITVNMGNCCIVKINHRVISERFNAQIEISVCPGEFQRILCKTAGLYGLLCHKFSGKNILDKQFCRAAFQLY